MKLWNVAIDVSGRPNKQSTRYKNVKSFNLIKDRFVEHRNVRQAASHAYHELIMQQPGKYYIYMFIKSVLIRPPSWH